MQHSLRSAPWLAVALLAVVAADAHAGAGSIDPSFGDQGVVITPIGPASHARDVVRQADGKLVVVGLTFDGFDGVADFVTRDFALARYHPDGTLDTTFGTGGVVVTDFGSLEDVAAAAAIQPDGKILAAGWGWRFGASSNPFDIAIARYDTDGSLDATFGLGGLVATPVGEARSEARAIVVQDDGKIVIAGSSWMNGATVFTVARYLTNGSLDTTFGTGGIFTMTPSGSDGARAHGLAVQADGAILVGGDSRFGVGNHRLTLLKLLANGTLDATFGAGGIAFGHEMIALLDRGNGLVLQPDGKILVASENDYEVTRFNADGTLDATFGTLGRTSVETGAVQFGTRLELDGKIMAIGYSTRFVPNPLPDAISFAFGRFLPDGTPDPSFGTNGVAIPIVQTEFGEGTLMEAFGWSTVADGADGLIAVGAVQHTRISLTAKQIDTPAHFAMIRLDLCDCPPCFVCDGAGGCEPGLRAGCRRPITTRKSTLKLQLRNGEGRVAWGWKKGEAVDPVHLQDPLATDDHTLCVFGGDPPSLLLEATAPAGGVCPTDSAKPCWAPVGRNPAGRKGFKYKDRDRTPDGLKSVLLKAGATGKASVKVQGGGEHLPLPTLPAPLPVVVQLQGDHGRCWEATFSAAGITRNTADHLKAKSD